MTSQIRSSTEQDLKSIQELLTELGYGSLDTNSLKQTWKQIISSDDMGIIVAHKDEIVCGYLAYSFKPQLRLSGLIMEIDELCISTKTRGQGVGSQLLDKVKEMAKGRGTKRIVLSTNRERESFKRGFYLKNGFQEKNSATLKIDF